MKGIILAGGRGERLFPITRAISKQLLPVYDKPMVFYPLCSLMRCGIREILVITRPDETARFRELLADGAQWGLEISYGTQDRPRGIAEAPIIAADFIGESRFALALGDNIFFGADFDRCLDTAISGHPGATVFLKDVGQPERYGVMSYDDRGLAERIVEKPAHPPSSHAVTGLYIYDTDAVGIAQSLAPSARGEIEITDVNNAFLSQGRLGAAVLPASVSWMDMGTPQGLLEASRAVAAEQEKLGVRIGVPEQVALRNKWIDAEQVLRIAEGYGENDYGRYLHDLVRGG
ncbi:MAG: NTP transferase domain-containing protein [Alphaproteobacteria bacterium]|nr:NTP transferase domain-containing protein [Alphaproteobacteria bacterium]